MWIVGLGAVVGLIIGAMIGRDLWIIGGAAGALAGWAISARLPPGGRLAEKLAALSSEVKDLSRRLAAVEAPQRATPSSASCSAPTCPARRTIARVILRKMNRCAGASAYQ